MRLWLMRAVLFVIGIFQRMAKPFTTGTCGTCIGSGVLHGKVCPVCKGAGRF